MRLVHELATVTPVLRIFDEGKACAFYQNFLGYTVDWVHRYGDGFPLYTGISSGECRIHLTEHHGDATPGSAVRILTQDVRAYNQELLDTNYGDAKPGVETTP